MKYYRYLDLDHTDVCEKLKKYVIENIGITENFWMFLDTTKILNTFPEIQVMFNPLNITIKQISLVTTRNTSIKDDIHIDHADCNVRINIPIMNCERSVTNFYSSNTASQKLSLNTDVSYYQFNYNDCRLMETFCLDRPAALKIREPHQVIANKQCLPRISCTIEFFENIEYLLD